MKFKEFYNPKHVYEGYFETYLIRPFFHHYADFSGKESWKSGMLSVASWAIVMLGLAGLLMGLVGILGPEVGFSALYIIGGIALALSICPIAALLVRCMRGTPAREPKPRMLGVDTLMLVSCLLFFLLGLFMMTVTLNSGNLNPNAGVTDEDTTSLQLEEVTEEPIFTYQNDEVASEEPLNDSLSDITDPDAVSPEESFDPSLAVPEEEVLGESTSDSI